MTSHLIASLVLIAPMAMIAIALLSWRINGIRPSELIEVSRIMSVVSMVISLVSGVLIYQLGNLQVSIIEFNGLGISIRLDALSVLMLNMVSLIGMMVLRFSINYMDGDSRHGAFIGRMATTVAAAQLMVISGNLAMLLIIWALTSMALHRLLLFYNDRPGAIIAARKKFVMARLSDLSLAIAVILLYLSYGTGDLETIFQTVKAEIATDAISSYATVSVVFLVMAALFKSAQFPTHGWLIEVMETPTPVSALLHAGLLNAGPFLMVRMSTLLEINGATSFLLILIGGFTAIFGSVVYLTQSSIKTALSYSSIAHMGFSLLACGLGVYSAAMLHLVSHSFYKAHAFLSSGSVIEELRATRTTATKRLGSPVRMGLGILLAVTIYALIAFVWGIDFNTGSPLLAVGLVIVLGLASYLSSSLDTKAGFIYLPRTAMLATIVTLAFFTFESSMHFILIDQLPSSNSLPFASMILAGGLMIAFASVILIQIVAPSTKAASNFRALGVHLRNGFYINTLFDNLIGAWHLEKTTMKASRAAKENEMIAFPVKGLKEKAA